MDIDRLVYLALTAGPASVSEIVSRVVWDRRRSNRSKAAEVGHSLRRLHSRGYALRINGRQSPATWEAAFPEL